MASRCWLAEETDEKAQQKAAELGIPRRSARWMRCLRIPISMLFILRRQIICIIRTPRRPCWRASMSLRKAAGDDVCQQSGELLQLATDRKLVNAVNFNIRMYPLAQQARSMVQSGELGDLFIVHGSYLQDWLLFPTDWNWRLEPGLGGTCGPWAISVPTGSI